MRKKLALFLLWQLICCFSAAFLDAQPLTEKQKGGAIDKYLSIRSEMGNFSGAILVARGPDVIIAKGFGFADIEKRVPFTPDTKHSIASVSKMFTAMAALKLRDAGKLKLDDRLCKFFDDCPEAWKPIIVQHLMRNTSGIPDYEEKLGPPSQAYLDFMTAPRSAERIVANAKTLPLDFVPGEKFKYSNTGFIVLSMVVERAGGRPFAETVERELLSPVGMKDSGVYRENRYPSGHSLGYTLKGTDWGKLLAGFRYEDAGFTRMPMLSMGPPHGDGGMYSTVHDLHKWSLEMDGGKVVSPSLVKEVYEAGHGGYGYGWFVGRGFDRERYRHNGYVPGYTSDLVKFPKEKVTIVVFSNYDRSRLSQIVRDVSSIVFDLPYDMPVRGRVTTLTKDAVERLEGTYKLDDGRVLTIKNEPDFLTAIVKDGFTAGLIPLSETEFYFPLADGRAIFTLDAEKRIAVGVNLRYSGEDHKGTRINQ